MSLRGYFQLSFKMRAVTIVSTATRVLACYRLEPTMFAEYGLTGASCTVDFVGYIDGSDTISATMRTGSAYEISGASVAATSSVIATFTPKVMGAAGTFLITGTMPLPTVSTYLIIAALGTKAGGQVISLGGVLLR